MYYQTKSALAPLVLGFHSGGYLFGGNALNDAIWSAVATGPDVIAKVRSGEVARASEAALKFIKQYI